MTFTTNHDHEDQRWMHAHERRTLDAYHVCLTDFTFTSPVTSFLLTAILLAILDFYSAFSLHDSNPQRQVLSSPSSAERLICKTFTIRSSEQALKHNRIYHSKVPSRFQQRSFLFLDFYSSGDWILASALSRKYTPTARFVLAFSSFCFFPLS